MSKGNWQAAALKTNVSVRQLISPDDPVQLVQCLYPLVLLRLAVHQHELRKALRPVVSQHRRRDPEDARDVLLARMDHVRLQDAAHTEELVSASGETGHRRGVGEEKKQASE